MIKFLLHFKRIVLIWICSCGAALSQQSPQQLIASYDNVRKIAPREKIYLHLDKSVYLSQDTIWFKAYLVDATMNSSSALSGVVYAELINSSGAILNTIALPTALGVTWGAFALKEDRFPPGNYTLRAYTNWMQNFGDTYIYKKQIKIVTTTSNLPVKAIGKTNLETVYRGKIGKRSTEEIDVQFLPEGGTWIADMPQKMAFKALNANGKGIEVNGEVIDGKQQKVVEFASNAKGMGDFIMIPSTNEIYSVRIKTANGFLAKNLPKAELSGTVLRVNTQYRKDSLRVTLYSNLPDQDLTIIGQSKGVVCFVANVKTGGKISTLNLAKNIFPTGVSQVRVVNNKQQVLNERNFFINLGDELKIKISTNADQFGTRDSIPILIKVSDYLGKPVQGTFSMAITDDSQVQKDLSKDANIVSYLLMSSELKGEIEDPGYYFKQPNEQTAKDLDLLMLTQGWVSYHWDVNKKPLFNAEADYAISGTITNLVNKPIAGAKVMLLGKNRYGTIIRDTLTNSNGEFVLNQFPLLDSASFIIQALNSKSKKGTLGINVNEFKRPLLMPKVGNNNMEDQPLDSVSKQLIATKNEAFQAASRSGIALREVKIIGKKVIKGSKNLNGPGEASQIVTDEDLVPIAKKTLYDVLMEKVKGFREGTRPRSSIREFLVKGEPAKFIIDGIELDFFYDPIGGMSDEYYHYIKTYLDYYNAEDINGIEVMEWGLSFKYKSAFIENPMDNTMYTFIEVTTKTGSGPFLRKSANIYLIKPPTYGNVMEFYSPRYTSANKSNKIPDFRSTIYWNPNIITNKTGEADISFFAADKKGTYTVWLEGTDTQGGLGMSIIKIMIK